MTQPSHPANPSAFEKELVKAMNEYADGPTPPSYDGAGIRHRAKRRNRILTTVSAAAVVAAVGAGTAIAVASGQSAPALTASTTSTKPSPTEHVSDNPINPIKATPWATPSPNPNPSNPSRPGVKILVPNVVGMTAWQAQRVLQAAGFRVRVTWTHKGHRAGTVIGSMPAAGFWHVADPRGVTITILVSQWPLSAK
ncbi:MAG TPA: PASTA domain-containing protein [Streptosporangiaceae bacterium]|nr:PASTA domain-containing protein [Streptosporangiaceae bacterium]